MPDNSRSWWRRGDPDLVSVKPLRARIGAGYAGQQAARNHLSSLMLHSSLARTKVWSAPQAMQVTTLGWWLMQLYWEMANHFLTGVVREDDTVRRDAYTACDQLCRVAEEMSLKAISNQSQVEVGLDLPRMTLQSLPSLSIDESTCDGVWAVYDAIDLQVQTDLSRVLAAQVPKRFQPVMLQLVQVINPATALHEYLQGQWLIATTVEVKVQVVRQAEDGAKKLFEAGQKLWAPYLLGVLYDGCLHARPTIDDLELGFDPWAITDPEVSASRRNDPKSTEDIAVFWLANPDPGLSYRLYREIEAAVNRRHVRYITGSAFPYCPWAPMWVTWRDVELGGVVFEAGTYISLYTGRNAEGDFVSEIRRLGRFNLEVGVKKR